MIIVILPASLYAQNDDIKFIHLHEGLSQSTVSCILQDKKGFMWFGTLGGLNRYDGYEFIVYEKTFNDSVSLSDNRINGMLEDSDDNLWIATFNGLNLFNRDTNKFIRYVHNEDDPGSLSHNYINTILEDSRGNLWVGTDQGGLNLLDKAENRFIHYMNDHKDNTSLSSNTVHYIYEDRKGNIWIGTGDGLLNLFNRDNQSFTHFKFDNDGASSLHPARFRSILEDNRGRLWIGTQGTGLILVKSHDSGHIRFVQYTNDVNNDKSLCNNNVMSMYLDKAESLWIGTENGGISRLDIYTKIFKHYRNDPRDDLSLSCNSIWSIYQDQTGRMWIGTYTNGLNVIDKYHEKFTTYRYNPNNENSLSNNIVTSFVEDAYSNMWIGTNGGGLNYFDRKKRSFVHYLHNKKDKNSLSNDVVTKLYMDSKGKLWAGTWAGGINVLIKDKKTFKHYNTANTSLNNDNIFGIIDDDVGNILIATFGGGLNIYSPKKNQFYYYTHNELDNNSISSNYLTLLYKDKSSHIWIGTEGNGLDLLNKNESGQILFIHYSHDPSNPHSLSNNFVQSIYEDSNHNLWIGTSDGLNLMDRKNVTFTVFRKEDGLPSNTICGILEDDHDNLWISTLDGLSRFNPQTKSSINYDVSDGLQGNEFIDKGRAYKSGSGEMFFGGMQGFNIFHPDSVIENPFIPEVYLTDFKIFNKSVDIGTEGSPLDRHITETKEMTLSHKQSVFTFKFVALNYTHPEKNQYAYMLEGFDRDWNYAGNKREATYTNLDPGEYIFRVKASNNDGYWNEEGTSLKITILPPWWQTWWFRIMIIVLLGVSIFTFVEYRIYSMKKQHYRLEQQVKERTHDLQLANTELEAQKRQIKTHADALERSNKELKQFAYAASHDLQEPLRSISSYISLILQQKGDEFDEETKHFINIVIDGSERMKVLINDLLEYSKISIQTKAFKKINLEQVLERVKINLKMTIEEKKAKITHDVLPEVMADSVQIERLFQNLIGNAIKYCKYNPEVHVSSKQKNGVWIISIRDNGIGIDPKYQDQIFGIFKRLHNRREYSGTGIGLAICKKIVEQYGGKIWVKSKGEGKGSTFYFTMSKRDFQLSGEYE